MKSYKDELMTLQLRQLGPDVFGLMYYEVYIKMPDQIGAFKERFSVIDLLKTDKLVEGEKEIIKEMLKTPF